MRRVFDVLTPPLRDNESHTVSLGISFSGARDFEMRVAPPVVRWFEFDGPELKAGRFEVCIRRIGAYDGAVCFSALITCVTDDVAVHRGALIDVYWPPPASTLFQSPAAKARRKQATLPLFVSPTSNLDVTGMQIVVNDSGEPRTGILEIPNATADRRMTHLVPFEFPRAIPTPRAKEGREWIHFLAAKEDLERYGDGTLSGDARIGIPDPPDIQLRKEGRVVGVELAQFTSGERRNALAITEQFRALAAKLPSWKTAHLRNQMVMVGFATETGLVPRDATNEDALRVVRRLSTHEIKEAAHPGRADLREGFQVKVFNKPPGQENVGLFPLPTAPKTPFGTKNGFEIAASYVTERSLFDVEASLAKFVREKDHSANEVLLVSAGAPAFGTALVADERIVAPELLEYLQVPTPKHLKRILLHRWAHRDVYEIYPRLRCLAPPIRHPALGGVIVLPDREIPLELWRQQCTCGGSQEFGDCHGKR